MGKEDLMENTYVRDVIKKMAKTLTEEERKKYIAELNKVARDRYMCDYHALCGDRQAVVRRLQVAGYPNI